MACGCATYECLEVFVNPCNIGTGLGIDAAVTGNYGMMVEFNGTWKSFSVAAIVDTELSVPTSVLNEQYTHEIRITPPSGITTCYKANTYPSSTATGFEPIPPDNDTWQWAELPVNGMTLSNDLLAGDISPIIWLNEQPLDWADKGITHVGDALDFTTIGGAYGTLIFQYKNLPV